MSSRDDLARKRLTLNSRVAELETGLDAAQHMLHEIVIRAFRREHGRDPSTKAEYRAYHRKLFDEAVAAMESRTEVPEWLATDDETNVRIATAGDVDAIMTLLVLPEISDAIPTLVHTPKHRAALREHIEECCAQPTSWLALGSDGEPVGFLVCKPKRIDSKSRRKQDYFQGVELSYAGVKVDQRGLGHFASLLDSALALGTPLYAVVKLENKSNMVHVLEKAGFVTWDPLYKMENETVWLWLPSQDGGSNSTATRI